MSDLFNWFPGHMAKSLKDLKEKIKLVDLVIELRDARIATLSSSPLFADIIKQKPVIQILTKCTYADQNALNAYLKQNKNALAVDLIKNVNKNKIKPFLNNAAKPIFQKRASKGIINDTLKILVIGFPNVGKSTFINFLNNKKSLKVGNLPGVTKSLKTWIKVDNLLLLDTPGILLPKFDDEFSAFAFALVGVVKEEILPLEEVITFGLNYLLKNYESLLLKRFNLEDSSDILLNIAKKRSCLKRDEIDYAKLYRLLYQEFKNGTIGQISFLKEKSCEYL